MTGRERLLGAINGKRSDRVPVTLFIQSQGHFLAQLCPDIDPWDFEQTQKKVIDFQRSLGADVHARMLFLIPHKPLWGAFYILNTNVENENWKITQEVEKSGSTTKYHQTITTPEGVLTQVFSINEKPKGSFMYGCTKSPIETPEDLRLAMKYEPSSTEEIRAEIKKQVGIIKDYIGDDGIVSSWCNGGIFNNIAGIFEQSDLYSLYLEDPEFYAQLMKFAEKRVYSYVQDLIDAGIDAIDVGGNSASGFIGNSYFRESVMPYEMKLIDFIQKQGVPVVYHNCGLAMELLPSYLEMGIKNIEPWSPAPLGDRDFATLQAKVGDAFSVTSGLDQVNVIQKGTLEDVKKATIYAMEEGKKLNTFIMQNVDFLEYNTPIENIEMYVKTALENAKY